MTSTVAGRRPDLDDHHLKVMIDWLSRAGATEREVVAAIEQATGIRTPRAPGAVERLVRRLTGRAPGRAS